MSGIVLENAVRLSNRVTRLYAQTMGDRSQVVFLSEYPKSGGSWLGNMLAEALDVPFPTHSPIPRVGPCVFHNHWGPTRRLHRVIYLMRDGRDTMVSLYFHRMRAIATELDRPFNVAMKRRYEKLFGAGFDTDDTHAHLGKFIESEMLHPRMSRLHWGDHVLGWLSMRDRLSSVVMYENLRADPAGEMQRITSGLDLNIDAENVRQTVDRFSFSKMAGGRQPGHENRQSFIRKGVVGDWRNHFNREAGEIFDHFAGDALVAAGYEPDRNWVTSISGR